MSPSRCESRKDAITALVTGMLGSYACAELLEHLETCSDCSALYEEMAQEEIFLQGAFGKIARTVRTSGGPGQWRRQAADRGVLVLPRQASQPLGRRARGWRRVTTFAVAAIVVLAAVGLFARFHMGGVGSGAAWAAVVQQVEKIRSATFTRTVHVEGKEPVTYRDSVLEPGRMRNDGPNGLVYIYDYVNGRDVRIDPAMRIAKLTHRIQHDEYRLRNYLSWVETLHEADAKLLGQADMEGRKTNVFRVDKPFEQFTVWADTATNLPVRIERVQLPCLDKDIKVPMLFVSPDDFGTAGEVPASGGTRNRGQTIAAWPSGVRQQKMTIVMTDFAWDVALDESLLQVRAPEGYQVEEVDLSDSPVDEQALIASLRFWAETSEGAFPADINMLLDSRSKLAQKFHRSGPAEHEFTEAVKMAHAVVNGLAFAQGLKVVNNWHYAGKAVRLGQGDTPLCWWKSEDASINRVIYGDLSIRDVPVADMARGDGR